MNHRTTLAGRITAILVAAGSIQFSLAQELPRAEQAKTIELFRVPKYCEGVCFDHEDNGYISWGAAITKFSLDGKNSVWAETGAPNGHKILADGTHLVCDASRHAVLKLSAEGKMLEPASKEDVSASLPPRTRAAFDEFQRCRGCGRVYWQGSHYQRLSSLLNELLVG